MLSRWDIINFFIEKNNYKSYLEVGYYKGWSFDQVKCKEKIAVDPNPSKTLNQESAPSGAIAFEEFSDGRVEKVYKTTSDEFFRDQNFLDHCIGEFDTELPPKTKWDIIFIDGLHERHQVLRDMKNAFAHLNEGGVVIMHDCNPPKEAHTKEGIDGCWTGDVYKAMLDIRNSPQCDAYVIDTDWGVGVVRPVRELKVKSITDIEHLNAIQDWDYFDHARKQLLGLIDISTFVAKERYNLPVLEL